MSVSTPTAATGSRWRAREPRNPRRPRRAPPRAKAPYRAPLQPRSASRAAHRGPARPGAAATLAAPHLATRESTRLSSLGRRAPEPRTRQPGRGHPGPGRACSSPCRVGQTRLERPRAVRLPSRAAAGHLVERGARRPAPAGSCRWDDGQGATPATGRGARKRVRPASFCPRRGQKPASHGHSPQRSPLQPPASRAGHRAPGWRRGGHLPTHGRWVGKAVFRLMVFF